MKCVICRTGETTPGVTAVTLHRGDTIVVIKEVPADICMDCGEYYLGSETTRIVYERADEAAKRNAEVEILRYAA